MLSIFEQRAIKRLMLIYRLHKQKTGDSTLDLINIKGKTTAPVTIFSDFTFTGT